MRVIAKRTLRQFWETHAGGAEARTPLEVWHSTVEHALMEMNVRPIHNEGDYEAALAEVDSLMDAVRGTLEGDRLEVLVTLIEAYEARHWPIDTPDPIEAIRIRMEQKNLRQRDLEPMIGSRARVSEILSRKRSLTLPMIRRLSEGLDLGADVLIREAPVAPRRPQARQRPGSSGKPA